MQRKGSWLRNKTKKEFRRQANAGETQRQTVYTLLLTFVPFATIVAALSVISNAEVVEALSRHVRNVDTALNEIRDVAGVEEDVDIGTLVRQAKWAFENKNKIERRFVEDAADPIKFESQFGWTVDGKVIRIGEEHEHLNRLASLTGEERLNALVLNILQYVKNEMQHERVEDLSKPAKDLAVDISEVNLSHRETIIYTLFLERGIELKCLNRNDFKLLINDASSLDHIRSTDQVGVAESGNIKIDNWIDEQKCRFRSPPEDSTEIENEVARHFRAMQVRTLWEQLPDYLTKINAVTISIPYEPTDFLNKNRRTVIARNSKKIMNTVLKPEEQGPLTRLAVYDKATVLLNNAQTEMRKKLLEAMPDKIDDKTADQVKKNLRSNPSAAQSTVDQYILLQCREVLNSKNIKNLDKDDLNAFPQVLNAISLCHTRIWNILANEINDEIKRRIDRLEQDKQQRDLILAKVPSNTLPQVANLNAENENQVVNMFDRFGLDQAIAYIQSTVSGNENYPLSKSEIIRLNKVLAEHIRIKAGVAEKEWKEIIGKITKVERLESERRLSSYRMGSQELEKLTQQVTDSILGTDACQYDAVRKEALKRAVSLIDLRRNDLEKLSIKHIKATIEKHLNNIETAPVDKTKRDQMAMDLYSSVFPINASDVVFDRQDIDINIKNKLIDEVKDNFNGLAIRRAINNLTLGNEYNPFKNKSVETLSNKLARFVMNETGANLNERDMVRLREKADQLHEMAKDHQLNEQNKVIESLEDGDLPIYIVGVEGDEKKALDAMEKKILEDLGHSQLGPSTRKILIQRVNLFVGRRVEYTKRNQIAKINEIEMINLPQEAIDLILKGKKAKAIEKAYGPISEIVCSKTNTPKLVQEASEDLLKKITKLVDNKHDNMVAIQLRAVDNLKESDIPDEVILKIVAERGEEESAIDISVNKCADNVLRQTDMLIGENVLEEVKSALYLKCKKLVAEKRNKELVIQCEKVEKSIPSYNIIPKGGQTFDEMLEECANSICGMAGIDENRRLPGTINYLKEKINSVAKVRFDELIIAQNRLDEILTSVDPKFMKNDIDKNLNKVTGHNKVNTNRAGIFDKYDLKQLNAMIQEFGPVAERSSVVKAARIVIRNEIVWKPEWFKSSYFSGTLENDLSNEVINKMKLKKFDNAGDYKKDIRDEVEEEYKRIYSWCNDKVENMVNSVQCKNMLRIKILPYADGKQDLFEWYENYKDREEKIKDMAKSLVIELVGL